MSHNHESNTLSTLGAWTARAANTISERYERHGLDVLVAHGRSTETPKPERGLIVSGFGSDYSRGARLSYLDIAVVSRATGRTLVLCEVEEHSPRPKTLIADVLATLVGDHVTFRGARVRDLDLGQWTTLLVLAKMVEKGDRGSRIKLLEERLNVIKRHLSTANASVGRIIMDTFHDEPELVRKLGTRIENAVRNAPQSRVCGDSRTSVNRRK